MNGLSRRLAAAAGLAAPAIYTATVIVGARLTPGYTHTARAISALTDADAPARVILSGAFVAYDLCLLAFALGLPRTGIAGSRRGLRLTAAMLAGVALAGIGMSTAFPSPEPGGVIPASGWVHIALAAVASLGSMAAVAAFAAAVHARPGWRIVARLSWIALAVILVSGIWAASAAAARSPVMGLAERVTIGTFMAWLLMVALALLRPKAPEPRLPSADPP